MMTWAAQLVGAVLPRCYALVLAAGLGTDICFDFGARDGIEPPTRGYSIPCSMTAGLRGRLDCKKRG
jgi:hypothetical protein